VCCKDQRLFGWNHSLVAHTIVRIISQFKAQTLIGSQCHSPSRIAYSQCGRGLELSIKRQWDQGLQSTSAFDCVRGHCPAYFNNGCIPVAGVSGRAHLRSAERHDMLVPSTRTQLGRRSFHVAAPAVWKALPLHLRSPSISRGQFRAGLKTHLFTRVKVWDPVPSLGWASGPHCEINSLLSSLLYMHVAQRITVNLYSAFL